MPYSLYTGLKAKPYHLSVGAVVYNEKKQILCHYFDVLQIMDGEVRNCSILMRETLENNETLENAVQRGLLEEFGAKGEIQTYIGSLKNTFYREDVPIEKTTVYFLVMLKNINESQRAPRETDPENSSELRWVDADELIAYMQEQRVRLKREDFDESEIVSRAKVFMDL